MVKRALALAVMSALLLAIPRPRKVMPVLGVTLAAGVAYLETLAAVDSETRSWATSMISDVKKVVMGRS